MEGNPGKLPIPKHEPKGELVAGAPPPEWLSEQARIYWIRLVPILANMRVLCISDLSLLERYCDLLADWKELRDYLHDKKVFTGDHPEEKMKSFLMAHMRKIRFSEHLLKLEVQFGMTPSARTRVMTDELWAGSLGTEPNVRDPFEVN